MLKDEISKSATLILVGAYGIMLLDIVVVAVVRAHIILIIMSVRIIVEAKWVQQLKLENAFSWLNYNLYALCAGINHASNTNLTCDCFNMPGLCITYQ